MTSKINKINSDEISSASERRESLNSVQFSDDSSESESSTGSVNVRTVHTIIATDIPNAIDSEITATAGSLEECYITDEIDVMKTVIKNTNESKINIEDNKDTCHDDNKIYNTTFDNELTRNKIITKVSASPLHTKIKKSKLTPKKDSLENSIFSTPTKSKVQFVNEKSRISILQVRMLQ